MTQPNIKDHFGNIQGNILAGFNKDFQSFIFFSIPDAGSGGTWLADLVDQVSTTDQVLGFNTNFKRLRKRMADPTTMRRAMWMNLALTYRGLKAIGVPEPELAGFSPEFRDGMAARAAQLGDVDQSAPVSWIAGFRDHDIHGVLLVAADRSPELGKEVRQQKARLAKYGLDVVLEQPGAARQDEPGHEHFGFKDGISQPLVLGVADATPDWSVQVKQGQDLIQPGEFILGYPSEASAYDPAPVSPAWAADGSYLVFRRLRQNVQGFRDFVHQQARAERVSDDLMGAKLFGRYKSGAPLERTRDEPPRFDPAVRDPSTRYPGLLKDPGDNNFGYRGDPDGRLVPRSAHIRKVNPRDAGPPGWTGRSHRIIRRGIAYGDSYQAGAPRGSGREADADRGLLFLCYQASIADQFEWTQERMANNANFPQAGDGIDPIISQSNGGFSLPGGVVDHFTLLKRWVTTTGGDYFFSPSISALRQLSSAQ